MLLGYFQSMRKSLKLHMSNALEKRFQIFTKHTLCTSQMPANRSWYIGAESSIKELAVYMRKPPSSSPVCSNLTLKTSSNVTIQLEIMCIRPQTTFSTSLLQPVKYSSWNVTPRQRPHHRNWADSHAQRFLRSRNRLSVNPNSSSSVQQTVPRPSPSPSLFWQSLKK